MGFFDFLKVKEYKSENAVLQSSLSELNAKFLELETAFDSIKGKEYYEIVSETEQKKRELQQLIDIKTSEYETLIKNKTTEFDSLDSRYNAKYSELKQQLDVVDKTLTTKREQCLVLDEQIMLESFSLYTPKFSFTSSEEYKTKLSIIREIQKDLIRDKKAATGNTGWTVNNSKSEGTKMVNDMIKLCLRSFNNECDSCVSSVKFNNIDAMKKRITASYDAITKLGQIMNVVISKKYFDLKIDELHLAHEYQIKKQEEKENLKVLREQQREEAKLAKEIEEARKNIEKDKKHFKNAFDKLNAQLSACTDEIDRAHLLDKIEEVKGNLSEIDVKLAEVDYREANQKAGYVYVISNLGAFGENIFKIGMTRRLEPLDRVDELGDASVPFSFDVHALVFSNDAPKLENALHRAFDKKKLNMVNRRKEFFNVTLDEIEEEIRKNHDKTIDFIKYHDAEEFRESQLLKETEATS